MTTTSELNIKDNILLKWIECYHNDPDPNKIKGKALTKLSEEVLAQRSNNKYYLVSNSTNDNEISDFTDGSDCKTSSITGLSLSGKNAYRGIITKLISPSGKYKNHIRVIIPNAVAGQVHYMFIPARYVKRYTNQKNKGIPYTYNSMKDSYGKLEIFRIKDIDTLAQMTEESFYEQFPNIDDKIGEKRTRKHQDIKNNIEINEIEILNRELEYKNKIIDIKENEILYLKSLIDVLIKK